jgi:hypothetical protein
MIGGWPTFDFLEFTPSGYPCVFCKGGNHRLIRHRVLAWRIGVRGAHPFAQNAKGWGTHSRNNVKKITQRNGPSRQLSEELLEARGGIEPPIRVLQTLALPLGHRATVLTGRQCVLPDFRAEYDSLGNLLDRTLFRFALPLQKQISFPIAEPQIALQNALTSFHQFASLQLQ